MSKKITKNMTFAEIMEIDREAGVKLAERGMFCGGCPMAQLETLENGAKAHGVDVDEILEELNNDGSNSDDPHSENLDDSATSEDCGEK
jgi:hybrid cluster-associated redox disulfide protein